jgi:hypothetical protein
MKTIKVKFWIETPYVGSEYSDEIDIKVNEGLNEKEVDEIICEQFEEWKTDKLNDGWTILDNGGVYEPTDMKS